MIADIDEQIEQQEKVVAGIREAVSISTRAMLHLLPESSLDARLPALLGRTIEGIAQDAERQLTEHLTDHGMTTEGAEWIATGIEHTHGDECPFCGQNIRGLPLVAAYRAVFSDGYLRLVAAKADVDRRKDAIRKQLDDHTKTVVEPYELRINALLDAFNAGFSITKTTHA